MTDDLESDDEQSLEDTMFLQATEQVQRTHAQLLPNDLLEFYALYKQATVGACNTKCPSIFNMQARAKWTAWHDLAQMSVEQAKKLYVHKLQELQPDWEAATGVSRNMSWVVHSVQVPPACSNKPEAQKNAFDFVKENNLQRLQQCALTDAELMQLDENGMSLLHWAADRGALDCLRHLLQLKRDHVNICDADKQTPLHYAASCDHLEAVQLLLNNGADKNAKDADGNTAKEVAENAEIRALLMC